jgi:catechol 2,3-dioxygenase-like lactoylglutathione lyase family enzyme
MIHHVQLAAPPASEDRVRAFWVETLGFAEVEKPTALAGRGGCWFRLDGIEVHVGIATDFHPARKAHPAFLVHDLEAWAQRLATAGYAVRWDADFPGMRRFYSEDPNGNRLEFLEPMEPQDGGRGLVG